MAKVRMLTDAARGDRAWYSGEEYGIDDALASAFVREGLAEYVTPPRPAATRAGRKVETARAAKPTGRAKR